VGGTDEWPFFMVSKFVDGFTLAEQIKLNRPSPLDAAGLVAVIADALHHAHLNNVFHRDVKPGNILLDAAGKPYVTDFGLALCEEVAETGHRFAGTPAYMSPEQARGEGHRLDGRSDVFGLGIVFYELLIGTRPFHGKTKNELLEAILTLEPRPPRQIDDKI